MNPGMQADPIGETEKKTGVRPLIRRRLIAGIATLIPIGATIWIVGFISAMVLHMFEPIWKRFGLEEAKDLPTWSTWIKVIFSWGIAFVAVYVVGLLSSMVIVRRVFGVGERMVNRIPVIKTVYGTAKQIVDTFSKDDSAPSQTVAVIEYPRKGLYSVGFITGETHIQDDPRVFVNVFVPATPNPTSGFLMVLPCDEVYEANMTVEEAFKFILSGGILTWDFKLTRYLPRGNRTASLSEIASNT
jgi:uncharacterized membrane protein